MRMIVLALSCRICTAIEGNYLSTYFPMRLIRYYFFAVRSEGPLTEADVIWLGMSSLKEIVFRTGN
jgi:hypothetical protein